MIRVLHVMMQEIHIKLSVVELIIRRYIPSYVEINLHGLVASFYPCKEKVVISRGLSYFLLLLVHLPRIP